MSGLNSKKYILGVGRSDSWLSITIIKIFNIKNLVNQALN